MPENNFNKILNELKKCGFKVSTDTRKDLAGSVYFALKGENFDGNKFVHQALEKGAVATITDNPEISGDPTSPRLRGVRKIYPVPDVLTTLQKAANTYRKSFNIPIIAIGGSNGKTTTKELLREILKTKYKVHATSENLNNHIGVPLSILSMSPDSETAIFEIGANHHGEHLRLLEILEPTIAIVTNSGMDHLEGFGSPEGVIRANEEITEWAKFHGATVPEKFDLNAKIVSSTPLTFEYEGREYKTNMAGNYNMENINWAVSVGNTLGIEIKSALEVVTAYKPQSKRSQLVTEGNTKFIVDCYNANPSSMRLALESFISSAKHPRGVVLGDMLELGFYAEEEHRKIVEYLEKEQIDCIILIGKEFKKVLNGKSENFKWFKTSEEACEWFGKQNFEGYTFLLKGSRGVKVEKILES